MKLSQYSLEQYVRDIKKAMHSLKDEKAITAAIQPYAELFAKSTELRNAEYLVCDEQQGFGVHLLHEEQNHELGVFVLSWLPNRGTLPHNHKTWAVVVVMEGVEHEVHWQRLDDGSQAGVADIDISSERTMTRGETSMCLSEDIHSVWNTGDTVSLSLHTYGKHINHTQRTQFYPEKKIEIPFSVTVAE